MSVLVFPGQGCQKNGMGASLFDTYPELVDRASEVLGYCIRSLCLDDDPRLHQTEFTQPALFFVNALQYLDQEHCADYVLGHSVGEYNALHASEVLSLDDALVLVQKRGQLMQSMLQGGMIAVLGLSIECIEKILIDGVEVANHNTPTQIVVSGRRDALDSFTPLALEAGAKRVIPLKVSGAFHSTMMRSAAETFQSAVQEVTFKEPKIPVVANVTGRPYINGEIPSGLVAQIWQRVRWVESIQWLKRKGESNFIEINAAKAVVLGMIKQIK